MALPKRKVSRVRRDRRRAHYLRIKRPQAVHCPNCQTLRLAHRVCHNCGHYKGQQIIKIKVDDDALL